MVVLAMISEEEEKMKLLLQSAHATFPEFKPLIPLAANYLIPQGRILEAFYQLLHASFNGVQLCNSQVLQGRHHANFKKENISQPNKYVDLSNFFAGNRSKLGKPNWNLQAFEVALGLFSGVVYHRFTSAIDAEELPHWLSIRGSLRRLINGISPRTIPLVAKGEKLGVDCTYFPAEFLIDQTWINYILT